MNPVARVTDLRFGLVSGVNLQNLAIRLYKAIDVGRAAAMHSKAQGKVGGASTGVGFWGSPTSALGGALVLGTIEQALVEHDHSGWRLW